MNTIYDLSWSKTSFLAKLQLFFKSRKEGRHKMRYGGRRGMAEAYSALSSTYYSIAATAFSKLRATLRPRWLIWLAPLRIIGWCLSWLPLAAWCYWRMLPLSDRAVDLIGYYEMSADQYNVRQSILRHRGRYDEAERCIRKALGEDPGKAHTRGLLHVGLADVYRHNGCRWDVAIHTKSALIEAGIAEKEDCRQAARIYRHCADLIDFLGRGDPVPHNLPPGNKLRRKAEELARSVGAHDQILKL